MPHAPERGVREQLELLGAQRVVRRSRGGRTPPSSRARPAASRAPQRWGLRLPGPSRPILRHSRALVTIAGWSRCTDPKASRSAGSEPGRRRASTPRTPDDDRPTFVDAHPPPNVTGELHMGHAMGLTLADALVRWKRMQGYNCLVPARLRPRGHLDAVGGREGARGGGALAAGARARAVRRAGLGLAPPLRADDHDPVPAHRRVDGLPPRADDDGRGLHARRHAPLRAPLGARLALPRRPDLNWCPYHNSSLSDLELDHEETDDELVVRPLPVRRRRRRDHDRDRPAGDDPRRRRRRGASRTTSATATLVGREVDRAVRRAARAGDRRRARRARVRHGRAEGDAGARPDSTSRSAARTACPSRR